MSHTGMECVHSKGLKLLHPGHIEDTIHSYTSQWVPFQAISHGIQIALLPPSTHRKPMAATQYGPLKTPNTTDNTCPLSHVWADPTRYRFCIN